MAKAKDDVSLMESKRITENQAFQSDVASIKKRVINFERYIKRLKQHVDEEMTAELITELENTSVAQVDMSALLADIKAIMNEIKEAKKFKI